MDREPRAPERAPTDAEALPAPASNDTTELRLATRDTVANLVPDAVKRRETDKPYRDVAGGWRKWR